MNGNLIINKMNVRNWNRFHSLGLIIGLVSPLILVPLVIWLISVTQNFYFSQLWTSFLHNHYSQSKMISLAILPNLGWFYWSVNKEKFNLAMGIIIGTAAFLPYIIYLLFA